MPNLGLVPNLGQHGQDVRFADAAPARRFEITARGLRYRAGSRMIEQVWTAGDRQVTGEQRLSGNFSLRRGDAATWVENAPIYGQVRLAEVAPGIDLVCYGNGGHLEHDLVVAPGADPNLAVSHFIAATAKIDDRGRLQVTGAQGDELAFEAPVAWQIDAQGDRIAIAARYAVHPDGAVGFAVADYDHSRSLVIDPVLVMSTYLGGSGDESAPVVRVDGAGNVVIAMQTTSLDMPVAGAVRPTGKGQGDLYVAKFAPDSGSLLWATYLAGSNGEEIRGMELAANGDVVVAANTYSADLPVSNAFQATFVGGVSTGTGLPTGSDAYIVRLAGDGSTLRYATYLGGSDIESVEGMALAPDGSAVLSIDRLAPNVSNLALKTNFPLTNPISLGGITNVGANYSTPKTDLSQALVKLGPTGAMVFSRPIGGMGSLRVDSAGRIYLYGKIGPYLAGFGDLGQTAPASPDPRASFTVFNPDLSVSFSSRVRIGSSPTDMAISADGRDVLLLGYRASTTPANFMQTKNAYQSSGDGPTLVKLTRVPSGTAYGFTYGSYFNPANSSTIYVNSAVFDEAGHFALCGQSYGGVTTPLSTSFPQVNALSSTGADSAGFLTQFDVATGRSISFSTLLPGGGIVSSVACDPRSGVSRYAVAGAAGPTAGSLPLVQAISSHPRGEEGYFTVIDIAVTLPQVSITASDATASESSGNPGQFTITRSGSTAAPLAVQLQTGGTASAADIQALPSGVTIPAGQASVTVNVQPIDDALPEPVETVVLAIIGGGVNYQLSGSGSATVSITDNDAFGGKPVLTIESDSVSAVVEGDYIYVPVKWVNYTSGGALFFSFNLQVTGTATPSSARGATDNDYQLQAGTNQVFSGQAYIPIKVFDDTQVEGSETLTYTILPSPDYDILVSSRTWTILDNDVPALTATVSIAPGVAAGTEGGANPTFIITATGQPATAAVQVLLSTPGGSAISGVDYSALPASVLIPPGQTTATISVPLIDDLIAEGNETVTLAVIANGSAYGLGSQTSATVSIADNDAGGVPPTVSIQAFDPQATEGGSDVGALVLQRNGTTAAPLVVQLTVGGTATAGADYTALPATVTIPAGQTTATVTIVPVDDDVAESPESVVVSIRTDAAYQVGAPASATVTILDNDSGGSALPIVTISSDDATAGESGGNTATILVSRTGSAAAALTIDLLWSGTAVAADISGGLPAQVIIPAGTASVAFALTPIDDVLVEGIETLIATVKPGGIYNIGGMGAITVTILDNDISGGGSNPGDLNGDKVVNITDLTLVTSHFGQSSSHAAWNPLADSNGDGVVNITDLTAVTAHFGRTYP